jgi:hypothetical protein
MTAEQKSISVRNTQIVEHLLTRQLPMTACLAQSVVKLGKSPYLDGYGELINYL